MNKISLLERFLSFAKSEPSGLALVTASGNVTFERLVHAEPTFAGKRVAILPSEHEKTISLLASNFGRAKSLTLFSRDMPSDEKKLLIEQGNFDVILSDEPENFAYLHEGASELAVGSGLELLNEAVDLTGEETEWFIPTSGTTSRPKLVKHSTASLCSGLNVNLDSHAGREVWGLLYDLGRFAGIQVLLQSIFSGQTLVIPPEGVSLGTKISFLVQHGVTHLSATPTLWRKILMTPTSRQLPLRKITLGGEAADQGVLEGLRAQYPHARITHVYASTEAGVGFWISDGLAGFPIAFLENNVGRPELDVREGFLWVRSAGVSSGYLSGGLEIRDGWVNTGDIVEVRGGRIFILGRGEKTINVGGDKVVAEKVRSVLLECLAVTDAFVFGRNNPITGKIIAAEVVLSKGQNRETARDEINSFVRGKLRETERPRVIRFVEEIAVNSSGKATARNG